MNNEMLEQYSEKEIKTDIMRYKNNGASFWLCMLAIILDCVMFVVIYKTKACTADYQLGFDLLVNVIFLLAVFLVAEKTKAYNKIAGYTAFGLGAIQIARIFWIPLRYFKMYLKWSEEAEAIKAANPDKTPEQLLTMIPATQGLEPKKFIICISLLAASCVSLVVAGIIALSKQRRREAHLNKLKEKE